MANAYTPVVELEPFAVRPKDGARLAGVGITRFYQLMNEGAFETFLDGNCRLITTESIKRRLQKLAENRSTPRSKPSPRSRPRKERAA